MSRLVFLTEPTRRRLAAWSVVVFSVSILCRVVYRGSYYPGWDALGPAHGLTGSDSFSLRLLGTARIPESGIYRTALASDDGSTLYLGGRPVVDNFGVHDATPTASLAVTAPPIAAE
jgi:hypothetical protein